MECTFQQSQLIQVRANIFCLPMRQVPDYHDNPLLQQMERGRSVYQYLPVSLSLSLCIPVRFLVQYSCYSVLTWGGFIVCFQENQFWGGNVNLFPFSRSTIVIFLAPLIKKIEHISNKLTLSIDFLTWLCSMTASI